MRQLSYLTLQFLNTVEPPSSGHPRDQKKCPFKRVSACGRLKKCSVCMQLITHDQVSAYEKCPPREGVR